ncbi:MAG: acyl-CoA dehydrogenase family protein [Pseudomonadales bacterium]|nr:acyl-CoA dehydrogenase family protein [Pseudomonadales bacterium]
MTNNTENEELSLFRENVRRFVNEKIVPNYDAWEKQELFPRELWNQLGDQGLLCVDVPESYGGYDASFKFSMVIAEEFMRANCSGVVGSMMVHSDIVTHYILNHGTEAQKQQYVPNMVSGDCVGAIAMTEPGAGSDLQAIRTTAKLEGDEYVINGSKTFITNGQHCDIVVVAAKTNLDVIGAKGTTLFIVDANAPGFSKGRNLEKIGLHAADTSELFFDDVRVPASAILGSLDQGFKVLMGELQRERLALSVAAVAASEGAIESTIEYVKERKAFGSSISTLQNTRFKLAEMATDIRVNKAFVKECVASFESASLDVSTVSMAKYSATEMQNRVVDGCLQLHGGYGYMREYGISRAFVDARIQRIYGGTSEIMKEIISRDILK